MENICVSSAEKNSSLCKKNCPLSSVKADSYKNYAIPMQ